jgi:hypothetical protein
MMRRRTVVLVVALCAVALPIFAQSTPDSEPLGEPELQGIGYPPVPVDQRAFTAPDKEFVRVAGKVAAGTASIPEIRAYFWMLPRLYPFDRPIPSDWRLKAQTGIERLCPKPSETGRGETATYPWWVPLGPFGLGIGVPVVMTHYAGRASALWVDPANKNIVLLGLADGGVWKTVNQGSTWTPILDGAASQSIGSIAVDPSNKNVIYVGTGEGNSIEMDKSGVGIYKSVDGGAHWTLLPLPLGYARPSVNLRRMAVDPRDTSKVYAVGDGGLYYSTNAGSTWSLATCGSSAPTVTGDDLVLDAPDGSGSTSLVFAAFRGDGIYRSAGGGAGPWTKVTSSPFPSSDVGRIVLAQAPTDPKRLYAVVARANVGLSGIFKTSDATATTVVWGAGSTTDVCSGQCNYDLTAVVAPDNPNHLIVGGVPLYLSADGGSSLASIGDGYAGDILHVDQHALAMPDASTVYVANDGGFWVGSVNWGTPSGTTWQDRNTNLCAFQFYGFAQHPTDGSRFLGGTQDIGALSVLPGGTWAMAYGGDGGFAEWDPSNPLYAYWMLQWGNLFQSSRMDVSPTTSYLCLLNFGGCHCNHSCAPDGISPFMLPIALDANNPSTLYAGVRKVWKSPNLYTSASSDWTAISGTLASNGGYIIDTIHSAKNNGVSGTLYVGTQDGTAWVTRDGGATWADISSGLPAAAVTSFATDPADGRRVLVTLSGFGGAHVFRSINAGASWLDISGSLPSHPFNTIVLSPTDSNHAYAGSDFGVFENSSVWTTSTWASLSPNLPAVSIQQLQFSKANGRLRAATFGRGLWELGSTGVALPAVSGVSPAAGAPAGGTTVVITGTNFTGATGVAFGGAAATSFTVNSAAQITAVSPAHAAAIVDVQVTTPQGTSLASGADWFAYGAAPSIASVSPVVGSMAGGDYVRLVGTGFVGATGVTFGGTAALSFGVDGYSEMHAVSPPHATGAVDVRVTSPLGTSPVSAGDAFSYVLPPAVTAVSPGGGHTAGGTWITITGTNFTGATVVSLGGTPSPSFTVNSATNISAFCPAHAAGTVDVRVATPGGTSAITAADQFVYTDVPVVQSISLDHGTVSGGTWLTASGYNLDGTTGVSFGGTAGGFTNFTSFGIYLVTPAHARGTVDMTVTTPFGTSAASPADRFTFLDVPTVTGVSPASGPSSGGTHVTITGTDFVNLVGVVFDQWGAASYTVDSPSQISAVTGYNPAETADVRVMTQLGTSPVSPAAKFTFLAAPSVYSLSPSVGSSSGGTAVTIAGANFTGVTGVSFGGTAAASFSVTSSAQLQAVSPAHSAETVYVTITTQGGTNSDTTFNQFTFVPPPAVSGLSPSTGPAAGGTPVTLTGTNLTGATAVSFGGTAAPFTVNSATQITATSPARAPGAVHVTVTTPYGTSATGAADQFTYVEVPSVSGVSPASGTVAGGASVTITGSGFTSATSVSFGGTVATFTVNSGTQITATSPAHAAGTVHVTVSTPNGTSATGAQDQFTYVGPPAVTGLSPTSGTTSGGTSVMVSGTDLSGATAVSFGGTAAPFTVNSGTQITATSPARAAGAVHVTVSTPNGTSATGAQDQFTYVAPPAVSGLSPTAGTTSGGTSVTVSGTDLSGATAVSFGGTTATFTVNSGTQITATSPARGAGAVHVTVTTPYGTSVTGAQDQFTYVAPPAVSGISPTSGTTSGGTSVTIAGSGFSGATAVSFGGTAATFSVSSPAQILATSPGHSEGAVHVTVATPYGTSTTGSGDQFAYVAPPSVTSVNPSSGPMAGGTAVVLAGSAFAGATAVSFGGTAASFVVNSPAQITATAPAHAAATVDVTVTTPYGTSAISGGDRFTFLPPPPVIALVKAVTPPFKLVVTGSNLQQGMRVFIEGVEWTQVLWKNAGKIQLTGAIKALFPKGVTRTMRFVNPDGGEASVTWTR